MISSHFDNSFAFWRIWHAVLVSRPQSRAIFFKWTAKSQTWELRERASWQKGWSATKYYKLPWKTKEFFGCYLVTSRAFATICCRSKRGKLCIDFFSPSSIETSSLKSFPLKIVLEIKYITKQGEWKCGTEKSGDETVGMKCHYVKYWNKSPGFA